MNPTRAGKFMLYGAWLLALGLLTLGFNHWLDRQRNPNQTVASTRSEGAVEVTLVQNRYGHYHATGSIDGTPVEFLLDTGATHIAVPGDLAARLGLVRGPAGQAQTANGVVTTYATRLARVRLGEIELRDVKAHINPAMEGDQVLLGMSFLRDLEFSQRNGRLTLRQAP